MSERQIVHTTSLFKMDDKFDDERFCKVRIAMMHTGTNRNGSRFSRDCVLNAKDTFKNIPILADVQEITDENGETHLDYTSHSMHVEEDAFNEGENKIIYDEKVVGLIPETNNFELVEGDEDGIEYVMCDGLILREYGNYAANILEERGGKTDVSMEISCPSISYDAKDKVVDVNEMVACAVTLLGDDVQPGMKGANAQTFSLNENSRNNQLLQIMQELKQSLDNYIKTEQSVENSEEGGIDVAEINEELMEEEVSTEEFAEETTEESTEEVTLEAEETSESEEDVTDETEAEAEVEPEAEAEDEEVNTDSQVKCSVSYKENTKEFSVTLSEQLAALSELVNDTYGDDLTWYSVDADDKNVVMIDCWNGKAYRQSYKKKGDSFTLKGDRVPVYSVYVTEEEKKALDDMKSNYSLIQERLEKFETEPQKMEILESEEYALVSECEEFASLKEQANHFDLSVDEVKAKADEITLQYAKSGKLDFAAVETEEKTVTRNALPINNKKTSRYGNLFSK